MEETQADKIIYNLKKIISEIETKKQLKKNNWIIKSNSYSINSELLHAIDDLLKKTISALEEKKKINKRLENAQDQNYG